MQQMHKTKSITRHLLYKCFLRGFFCNLNENFIFKKISISESLIQINVKILTYVVNDTFLLWRFTLVFYIQMTICSGTLSQQCLQLFSKSYKGESRMSGLGRISFILVYPFIITIFYK